MFFATPLSFIQARTETASNPLLWHFVVKVLMDFVGSGDVERCLPCVGFVFLFGSSQRCFPSSWIFVRFSQQTIETYFQECPAFFPL